MPELIDLNIDQDGLTAFNPTYGPLGALTIETGTLVGECGLSLFFRRASPWTTRTAELAQNGQSVDLRFLLLDGRSVTGTWVCMAADRDAASFRSEGPLEVA